MNTNADQPSAANGTNEPYLDQLHFLLGLNDSLLPSVLSTSYAEDEETVPCAFESPSSTVAFLTLHR
jgi:tripeptidyl-peptidase-1